MDIYVTCMGLPVFGFPEERVNPELEHQVVFVDYIRYRGVDYQGAYVALDHDPETDEFVIRDVALQPHLLRAA